MSGRRVKVVAAVVLLCLLGGCVDVTMTTTVDNEGEIEQVRAEAEMSQEVYALALEDATSSGYESVGEQFADELETNEDGFSDVEYEDRRENGTVVVELLAQKVTVEEVSYITTRVTENETVAFTASISDDVADLNGYTYRVEMPGEITETDATEIENGNVAVWELHKTNPDRVSVESEVEDRSWLGTFALVLGVIGVAMVGVAAYQKRVWESYV
ncbi:hypothetical protein [Saliphagus sp. LR7]|uniref:hypothetical protein n=1 Tax=Saliphagus sp. LR7 TaxID=2282654 RepID=UPI000DF83E87|nr:hypothetical protein [Saliphagus sp. LR7]